MFSPWFLICAFTATLTSALPTTPYTPLIPSDSEVGSTFPITNASQISEIIILPYSFNVPDTQAQLRLGFGLRTHSLDAMDMRSLIAVVQHQIAEAINATGRGHLYPIDALTGEQEFTYDLGDGIGISIFNLKSGGYFTWGFLSDVVEGLRLYLIVGERFRETWFNFRNRDNHYIKGGGCIQTKDRSAIETGVGFNISTLGILNQY